MKAKDLTHIVHLPNSALCKRCFLAFRVSATLLCGVKPTQFCLAISITESPMELELVAVFQG